MSKVSVRMFVSEMMLTYHVCFTTSPGQQQVGRSYTFHSPEDVLALMRRAHAPLEDINIVESSLTARRPCSVVLQLTPEQFTKLNSRA